MFKKLISRKTVSIIVSALLLGSVFTGCSKKKIEPVVNPTDVNKSGKITDKPVSMSFWISANTDVLATSKDLGQTEMAKELQKRTGVEMKYTHPAIGQETEQFNLMIASNQFPDIIVWNWTNYNGGVQKAMDDKIIIPLNDTFKNGLAPNFTKLLSSNPVLDKLAKTDNGTYFSFPMIREDDALSTYYGPVLRKDWLTDLKLEVPTTIDEWYTVLKAFKEQKKASAPLTFQESTMDSTNDFIGAFGIGKGMYQENGKIKYGPIENGYKDFLTTFNKWYKEGLLDPEYATQDRKAFDAKITGDKAGAFIGSPDSYIGTYLKLAKAKNPNYDLIGAPHPVLKKGETPKFMQKDYLVTTTWQAGISTQSKEKEIAAKWLDYFFSADGKLLTNFGIEGVSYKMENGKPVYTDLIKQNPDKLTMKQAMAKYTTSALGYGPGIQMVAPVAEQRFYPAQNEAIAAWMKADDSRRVPPITPTTEESKKVAKIMAEVNTYVSENYLKFVIGQKPLSEYDAFVSNIKKMGIDEVITINQAALERFNKR